MLARQHRLKSSRDISRVFRSGRFGRSELLLVKAAPNHLSYSRSVVVVSKKVDKRAVVRNRNRRRVAAELQSIWQTVRPGYDIVITVRADLADLTAAALKKQLGQAIIKAHVTIED